MRKIKNPYDKTSGYYCFGCSHDNPHGLQMTFYEDGEELFCKWDPQPRFQGYNNILHGGIQATLMDETASWLVYVKMITSGVTSRLDIKYKKPVPTNRGEITLRGKITEIKRNLAFIEIQLFDPDMQLCSSAEAVFFTYSKEYSVKNLGFPEHPQIYEDE